MTPARTTTDALEVSTLWCLRACEAWAGGDEAARYFVKSLAIERLNVWSAGDKRRGKMRADALKLGGELRIDAFEARGTSGPSSLRLPSALELARELRALLTYERTAADFARLRTGEHEDRCAAAIADAGASLVGMCAARRLMLRAEYIECARRAIIALLAVQSRQEIALAIDRGHYHAALEDPSDPCRVAVLHSWRSRGRALHEEIAKVERAGLHVEAPAHSLEAARLRGFEYPHLVTAPLWAFEDVYQEFELEHMAPRPRTLAGALETTERSVLGATLGYQGHAAHVAERERAAPEPKRQDCNSHTWAVVERDARGIPKRITCKTCGKAKRMAKPNSSQKGTKGKNR